MPYQQGNIKKQKIKHKKQKYYQIEQGSDYQEEEKYQKYQKQQKQVIQNYNKDQNYQQQYSQNYLNQQNNTLPLINLQQQSIQNESNKLISLNYQQKIKIIQTQNHLLIQQNNRLKSINKSIIKQNQQLHQQYNLLIAQINQLKQYNRNNNNNSHKSNNNNSHINDHNKQNYQTQITKQQEQTQIIPIVLSTPILKHSKQLQQQLISHFLPRKIKQYKLLYRAKEHNFSMDQFYKQSGNIKNTVIICLTNKNKIIGGFSPFSHKYTGQYRDKQWLYAYDIDKLWLTKDKGQKYQYVPDSKKQAFLFQLNVNKQYKKNSNNKNQKYDQQQNKQQQINKLQQSTKSYKYPLKHPKISIQRHQKNKCIYFGSGQLIIGQYPYFYYEYKMKQKQDYNTCMTFNICNNLSSYEFLNENKFKQQPNSSNQPNNYIFNQNRYLNLGNYFNLWNPSFTTKYQHQHHPQHKQNWLQKCGKSYQNQYKWNGNKTNIFALEQWQCWQAIFQNQHDHNQKNINIKQINNKQHNKQSQLLQFYNNKPEYHIKKINEHKQLIRKINKQKSFLLLKQIQSINNIKKSPSLSYQISSILKSQHILQKILPIFEHKIINNIQLIYKASQNEFSTKKFYQQCNHQSSILILCQTINGVVIGAYNPLYYGLLTEYDSAIEDAAHQSEVFVVAGNRDRGYDNNLALNQSLKSPLNSSLNLSINQPSNPVQRFKFSNKTNSLRRFQSDNNIRFGGGMLVLEDGNKQGWSYIANTAYVNTKYSNFKVSYNRLFGQNNKYIRIKQWEAFKVGFSK